MSTIEITYDGTQIIDVMWPSANFESQMGAIPGTFEFTVKDDEQTYDFTTGKHITLTIDGQLYFGGIVTQVTRKFAFPVDDTVTGGTGSVKTRQWVLRGVDYNIWFDKRVIFNLDDPVEAIPDYTGNPYDRDVIMQLCADWMDLTDTDIDFSTEVDSVDHPFGSDTTTYVFDTPGTTWREVMKDITQWTGAIYYINHEQVLHYHDLEVVSSAWDFSDLPNNSSTFGFRDFSYTEDGTALINDALVWGGSAWTSAGLSTDVNYGRWQNATSIGARGRWQRGEQHFNENGYASDNHCALHAKIIVEGNPGASGAGLNDTVKGLVNPQKQVRLTWFSEGVPSPLIPGSVVTITVNSFGLAVALPVRNIRISFPTPTDARFEGFFGITTEDPWTLWKYMRQVQSSVARVISDSTIVTTTTGGASGSTVQTTPTPDPDGVTTTFAVANTFASNSTKVFMNGLLQRRDIEYTEDPSNGNIIFGDAPLTGDTLYVEYIEG